MLCLGVEEGLLVSDLKAEVALLAAGAELLSPGFLAAKMDLLPPGVVGLSAFKPT